MPTIEEIISRNRKSLSFSQMLAEVANAFSHVTGVSLKEQDAPIAKSITEISPSVGAIGSSREQDAPISKSIADPTRELTRDEVMQLTLSAIPELDVTELGWTRVTTPADDEPGVEVSGPARQQLMNFLDNIEGEDLQDKLNSLSKFYNSDEGVVQIAGDTPQEKIKNLFSYLVFYKTLTKVISNFNAASAGFSFESFLSVLTKGQQIKANEGTIADFTQGDGVPISLKLYQEGAAHVGGSFEDLVEDLVNPKSLPHDYMQYLIVLKDFGELKQGLDIKGTLKWYRFNFTLDNIANIIANTSVKYSKCIQLPVEFIENNQPGMEQYDFGSTLPAITNLPSPEELESEFISNFDQELKAMGISLGPGNPDAEDPVEKMSQVERILQAINYAKSPESFNDADPQKFGGVEQGVVRGVSKFNYKLLFAKIRQLLPEKPYREQQAVWRAVAAANQSIIEKHAASKKATERAQRLSTSGLFASAGDSAAFYNSLTDPSMKKLALKNSRGVLATLQFSLNRGQVYMVADHAGKYPSLPEGQTNVLIGTMNIGRSYVADMLRAAVEDMNNALFELFKSVQIIVRDSQAYVAGGMEDDVLAQNVIISAEDVSTRISDQDKV